MPPIKDNKIDANEAELIGDFLTRIGNEIGSADSTLRADVLKEADRRPTTDYYRIDDASAQYKMELEIGVAKDGSCKKRTSEVIINANYKRVSSGHKENAPFNLLFLPVSRAEQARARILKKFKEKNIDISPTCPILGLPIGKH